MDHLGISQESRGEKRRHEEDSHETNSGSDPDETSPQKRLREMNERGQLYDPPLPLITEDQLDPSDYESEDDRSKYHRNAPVTEVSPNTSYKTALVPTNRSKETPERPDDLECQSCQCTTGCPRKGRGRKPFCCSSWGATCSSSCACAGGCDSLWSTSTKARLFGPSDDVGDVFPNACFLH
jgi:hypothetical protein